MAEEVEQHRVAFAIEQATSAARIGMIVSLVVSATAYPGIGVPGAIVWAVVISAILLARNRILHTVSAGLTTGIDVHRAWNWLAVSSLVLALALAMLPAAAIPALANEPRLILTLFICCWCAAGMSSLGVTPTVYSMYLVVVLGGTAIGWLRADAQAAAYMALALTLYGAVLRVFSVNFSRKVWEGIAIRSQNAELVRQLSAANEAKTRFIMAASHDLRQPLHAISYLGGVLARATDPRDLKQASEALTTAVSGLNNLFSAILDLSRIESGAIRTVMEPVQVDALIAPLDAQYRALCLRDNRGWGCQVESAVAWTDPNQLERILRNLLDNALKHGGDAPVRLSLWNRDAVIIEVADLGPGIPPQERQKVFQEFYRIHDTSSGLGLGLSIVRRLCERLQCALEIDYTDPTLELGTRVTLRLPKAASAAAAGELPGERQELPHDDSDEIDVAGMSVLVVDDDAVVVDATRTLLRQWGCKVATCRSSAEVDDAVRKLPHLDIALVDYDLGKESANGIHVLATLRHHFPDMGVAVVTGESDPGVMETLQELGVPILEKPVAPADLRHLLGLFKSIEGDG